MLQKAPEPGKEYAHPQMRYPLDTRVALVVQILRETEWVTVKESLRGTLTGFRDDSEDSYSDAYVRSILTDEPLVVSVGNGKVFEEAHPHLYNCEPQHVDHPSLGKVIMRLSVEPLTDAA